MAINDTPIEPFGATIAGVNDLVPEARLVPGIGPLPEGQFGVTEGQVGAWVGEISGLVAITLDGWERLPDTPDAGEGAPDSDRAQFKRFARTVVHNGAASYLEAARFPERSSVNDTSYAAVLWDRYKTGLEQLGAWLRGRLVDGVTDEPGDSGGPVFNFPEPLFGDALRF